MREEIALLASPLELLVRRLHFCVRKTARLSKYATVCDRYLKANLARSVEMGAGIWFKAFLQLTRPLWPFCPGETRREPSGPWQHTDHVTRLILVCGIAKFFTGWLCEFAATSEEQSPVIARFHLQVSRSASALLLVFSKLKIPNMAAHRVHV